MAEQAVALFRAMSKQISVREEVPQMASSSSGGKNSIAYATCGDASRVAGLFRIDERAFGIDEP